MTALKLIDASLRREFNFQESWETEIRARWEIGDYVYYAAVIWCNHHSWIAEHKIVRIKNNIVEISYREQWVQN